MSELLEMLGLPFLACLMMSGILAYAGMHVLRREIIFIDITLAQVAAVGSILAHLAFGAHEETLLSYVVSLACVLVLAAFYALLHKRPIQLPIEAVIGVSFAIAAAGGVFLISLAPTEMHADEMLAGCLMWSSCWSSSPPQGSASISSADPCTGYPRAIERVSPLVCTARGGTSSSMLWSVL